MYGRAEERGTGQFLMICPKLSAQEMWLPFWENPQDTTGTFPNACPNPFSDTFPQTAVLVFSRRAPGPIALLCPTGFVFGLRRR